MDLAQIYECYLSQIKTTDRIDKVGARVVGQVDDVMTILGEAFEMSSNYDATLNGASQTLSGAQTLDQVRSIVETVAKSTRQMRDTNKVLEERLATSKSEISDLQHSLEAMRAESLTDPLTGLGNRKYFDPHDRNGGADVARQQRAAIVADGRHRSFKSFNDSYGHLTGDQVVRLVGQSLKELVKGQDITARYGGEEFAALLPNTALRQALSVADQLRRTVMAKELK